MASLTHDHIRQLLYSIFLNSVRATVETGRQRVGQTADPVSVLVVKSDEEISIKISDLGGGVERGRNVFSYHNMSSDPSSDGLRLPVVRKTARYLGGEVSLASLTGLATEVVLHLKSLPGLTREHFP